MLSGHVPFGMSLTANQKETLANAPLNGIGVTLRLTNEQLSDGNKLALTKRQSAYITKTHMEGTWTELKLRKTQIIKMTKTGGFCRCLPFFQ